ncbi:MAG TPA: hypothetical protein VIG94_08755 [Faecalibacter sp.]
MIINRVFLSILFWCSFYVVCYSQLGIGKKSIEGSVLIDFAENTTNGLILPHVEDVDTMMDNTVGTLVFDKKSKKIKYYNGTEWIALNKEEGAIPYEPNDVEKGYNQGVIIGSEESDAIGVLILESEDKALVLPKIENPAKNVPSPYAGMICLDTISNNVYIFNGVVWEILGI